MAADLRLHGARILSARAGAVTHVFDDAHAPYVSMAAPYVPVAARLGEQPLSVTATAARAGRVLVYFAPITESGTLSVGAKRWSVQKVPESRQWPELAEEWALMETDAPAALAKLEARLDTVGALEGMLRVEANELRVKLVQRVRPEDTDAAIEVWAEAAAREGQSERYRALRTLAYYRLRERRFPEALALLDRATAGSEAIGDEVGIVLAAYYRGQVLAELGQYRQALQVTQAAIEIADAAALVEPLRYVVAARYLALAEVGRFEEAWSLLQRAERWVEGASVTEQGSYAADRGWVLSRGMAAGAFERDWNRVQGELARARDILVSAGRRDLAYIPATNLLYARYQGGDLAGARTLLASMEADASLPEDVVVLTRLMRGHLALADGRSDDAARAYESALERATRESAGRASDLTWRAHYGLARAQPQRSAAHFIEAMNHLEAVTRRTEIAKDRATFIDDRRQLFADAVEAFAANDRNDLAVLAADRSRAQTYRVLYGRAMLDSLDEEDRLKWRAGLDRYDEQRAALEKRNREEELVAPKDLPAFRAETAKKRQALEEVFDAAFAFVENTFGSTALDSVEPIQASLSSNDALLVPFEDGDTPVWFGVTRGTIRRFTARPTAPWWDAKNGTLFVATMGADDPWSVLGTRAEAKRWLDATAIAFVPFPSLLVLESEEGTGPAVVVGDTASNLPVARREAERVGERLEASALLLGRDATRARVLDAVANTSHFHFAGHGVLDAATPWDAHLVLANDERLTVEDLFARRPRARRVVLSGCETGRSGRLGRTIRIGLPDAFIASGSRTVVATTRRVSDDDAAAFVERFYGAGGARTPIDAFRRAALASNDDTWSAFYVLGGRR
ncbi:MAG: CHAT domain-containing protein [Deltaproteobacteria bacterium]